ncbi:hypothetical protein AB0I22_36430 [Streptomyces sp. NPDC050610]|uniref:hypothetical protein n=1 Tax=Streptomyces sp. NPDC050610 TaxID=3157097 RepID=UPI003420CA92
MGSLRNPIGPLPSSIYWRRRSVALALIALLVLLVVWAVNLGGSGSAGKDDQGKGSSGGKGSGPTNTITPGPTPSGTHYSQRPGGRDESGSGGGSGGSDSGGSGGGSGSGGTGSGGAGGAGVLGAGDGKAVPAGSSLPECTTSAVHLTVRSVKNTYAPDEKPKFEVIAKNTGSDACKVDFGVKSAVLKIAPTKEPDKPVWSSGDCPKSDGPAPIEVAADSETKRTVEWDRKPSAANCATPATDSVKPGTYLVEAEVPGLGKTQGSFVLAED